MSPIAQNLLDLFVQSIKTPRPAARKVLDLPAEPGQAWAAFVAMILLSVVITGLGQVLLPVPAEDVLAMIQLTPFTAVAIMGGMTFAVLVGIVVIGRLFGGKGTLDGGLRLFAWIQAILIVIQLGQFAAMFILPPLAVLISLASIALFFWLLVSFTAELHDFEGWGHALIVLVLAFTITSFVLISLISFLGLVPILETPNV